MDHVEGSLYILLLEKRGNLTSLIIYFPFFHFFFFEFYIGEKERRARCIILKARIITRNDSCCIGFILCLHMIRQHVLHMQALALNGEWKNTFIFRILFKSMKINDYGVSGYKRNLGFTDILLLGYFMKNCSNKELMYLIAHSSFFVRG